LECFRLGCSGWLAAASTTRESIGRQLHFQSSGVTLEGVLVSDPNYSVLTQIQLHRLRRRKPALPPPCPAPVSTPEIQQIADLAVGGRSIAAGAQFPRCHMLPRRRQWFRLRPLPPGFAAVAAECGYCAACHGATKHRPWLVTTRAASCNCRCPVRWKPDRFAQSHSHNASLPNALVPLP